MGLFKQMKQMKESVAAAPELVQSAMDMQAAAAVSQAAGSATTATTGRRWTRPASTIRRSVG